MAQVRSKHNRGYMIGALLACSLLIMLFSPLAEPYLPAGPMLPGHELLRCEACHKTQAGTLRQKLQANVQYLLGNRTQAVSVGYRPVTNNECLDCHQRPNDRHPVYRFIEPKYRSVRREIGAHQCNACHREHNRKRISVEINFCQVCHDELKLKNDPIDIEHDELIKQDRWSSCLGCHDFHGNHKMKTPHTLAKRVTENELKSYFDRAKQPYPGEIIYKVKEHNYAR